MISLNNVTKVFKTKSGMITAVDNVKINIKEGEIFGIIGYSGAGKSTLVRMFNGLERPTKGTITIDRKEISKIRGAELRKARQEIGMIFQHFNLLWSRTVRENISFPLEIAGVPKAKRKKRVEELIKLVGLEGREDAYPSQLSGGQKQRVGIARALANNPKVLLCDEATSALDPETTDSILDLLLDINKKMGLTIILITHEMHVIRKIAHRVAVMENGKVVEVAPVMEIFKNPKTDITKRFVQQITDEEETMEAVQHLLEKYSTGKIVKLTFIGETAEQPIISELIKEQSISINILQGKISQTRTGSYGTLLIQLVGDTEHIDKAIEQLKKQQVGVEVISHD